MVIVTGLALVSAFVGLTEIWTFQLFAIILPGTLIYLWARDAE